MPDSTTRATTAKVEAERLLRWAKEHNLLARQPMEEAVDAMDQQIDTSPPVSARFFSEQRTTEILRRKAINLIGYNETEKLVYMFLKGKLTSSEFETVPFSVNTEIGIKYIPGGVPYVKGTIPIPFQPKPFYTLNGKYCCGSSIFPANCIGAGTLGLFARDNSGKLFGISNNHVSGACNNAHPHLPILAPGPLDVTDCELDPFTIGRHHRLLPIHDGLPENIPISQNFDASCFAICNEDSVSSMQGNYFDTPSNVTEPIPGLSVEKVGRTTGKTRGKILCQSASPVAVQYSLPEYQTQKTVYFDSVFVVQGEDAVPFSRRGDSGSLVVMNNDKGEKSCVGIIFAGDEQKGLSFLLPLSKILREFDLNVCSGLNV